MHKLFWLAGQQLFEGERPLGRLYAGPCSLLINHIYLCPVCGDVWARMFHEPSPEYDNLPPSWQAFISPCQRHGGGLLSSIWSLEFQYPLPLLRHDAELLTHREPLC